MKHLGSTNLDVLKQLNSKWMNLSANEKLKWQKKADQEKSKYEKRYIDYISGLTDEQCRHFLIPEEVYKAKKEKAALPKQLGKPRRPLNKFALFGSEMRKLNKAQSVTELAKLYKNLSKQEIDKYDRMFNMQNEKYQVELQKWEERMKAEGRDELIRKSQRETTKS